MTGTATAGFVSGMKLPQSGADAADKRKPQQQDLREQNRQVLQNKEVLCSVTNDMLDKAIRKANNALDQGTVIGLKAKEASAHAQLFATLAECGLKAADKLVQQTGRDPVDLVRALRMSFVHTLNPQEDGEHDDAAFQWHEMGASVRHFFKPGPQFHCMQGPMDAQPKERKAAVRVKRAALQELVRPDELEQIVEEDKQETDRNMELMWNIIKAQGAGTVPLAELCCNHSSFAQTVENMFTLAFLVRDNRVAMLHDASKGLSVKAIEQKKSDNAALNTKPPEQHQFIVTFHMDDWDLMRELVPPEACLMPNREPAEPKAKAAGAPRKGAAEGSKKQRRGGSQR